MICRIAIHEKQPSVTSEDNEKARDFRAWIKQQPGFTTGYHVQDPETGKTLSITFWETKEHLLAMKDRTPPGGPIGLEPASVETFFVVEEF